MEPSSLSSTSRKNADKNLRTILLAGLGSSMALHTVAVAGVTHFWKPTAVVDEPMEITMVDVDKPAPAPVIVKSAPKPVAFKPEAKIAPPVVPIVKVPARVIEPKPAPKIVTPPPAQPIPIVKTAATLTPNPSPKANKSIAKNSAKPARTSTPFSPGAAIAKANASLPPTSAPTKPTITPTFPDDLFRSQPQPVKTNNTTSPKRDPLPKIVKSDPVEAGSRNDRTGPAGTPSGGGGGLAGKLSNNPNPGGSGGNAGNEGDIGAIPSSTNQSGLVGSSSDGGKLARGSGGGSGGGNDVLTSTGSDGDFGTVAPSKIGATGGDGGGGGGAGGGTNQSGLTGGSSGGGKLTRGFGGGSGGGSGGGNGSGTGDGNGSGSGIGGGGGEGDFGTVGGQGNTWRGARGEPGGGLSSNPGGSPGGSGEGEGGGGSGGVFGLQCISRCEISGLTDLEDNDGGKDKLRIKIAIDRKGLVIGASVVKSSGNAKIDLVVINGVKQMQFSPPGKTVERVVKANILI